jgi:1-acyl-sn-glycerol-3-phosphate acyltransferase
LALGPEDVARLRRQRFWSRLLTAPTYLFLALSLRLRYGYRIEDVRKFRDAVWAELDKHQGGVIWAANHHTLIDSFLIFWAVFPPWRVTETRRIPWSTPEYTNYYKLGGPLQAAAIRSLMYLCRCIPFLREGDDARSVAWRENVFDKCVWLLREGETVFVYPEAQRSRSGWLERRRPKDFLGRMALQAPDAKFLAVYLRGEKQLYRTAYPEKGDRFRAYFELIPAVLPGETQARQVSQRLFDKLSELQNQWFQGWSFPKNCGGNDVVDLKSERLHDVEDEDWVERHLTEKELAAWRAQPDRFRAFWRIFAAKEASHKALLQAGVVVNQGAFKELETDLFRGKVRHLPTGMDLDARFTDDDEDKLHCLAVLRGGYIGDAHDHGDFIWTVDEVPAGASPSEFVRERCLRLIAESNDEIGSPSKLAFTSDGEVPRVLYKGKPADWGVSLSHSGRFAASSFMIS